MRACQNIPSQPHLLCLNNNKRTSTTYSLWIPKYICGTVPFKDYPTHIRNGSERDTRTVGIATVSPARAVMSWTIIMVRACVGGCCYYSIQQHDGFPEALLLGLVWPNRTPIPT